MSMTETDAEVNSADVTSTKEILEREKLALEIEQLKQPWWKKPTYILAALPTLLAVVSVIYGFANGYFQAAAIKLENQKRDVEVQIRVLQEERQSLEKYINGLNFSSKELRAELDELKNNIQTRLNRVEQCEALKEENEKLKKETQRKQR